MRIGAREDIGIPAEAVFALLADFAAHEQGARRRGATILCEGLRDSPEPGLAWDVSGHYRGKQRRLRLVLEAYDPPIGMVVAISGGGFESRVDLGVVAMARGRSRLLADLEVRPRSLGARILMQSLRLGRAALVRRLQARLREFAARAEARHRAGQ